MTNDQRAVEQAQEAVRTKRDFLAYLRHELRTPINAVIGYSEMLIEEMTDEDKPAFIPDLKKIHESGKQLLAVVNTVLDPARIEAILLDPNRELSSADLHHELRTPLNAVIGYSEMLIEEVTDRGQRQRPAWPVPMPHAVVQSEHGPRQKRDISLGYRPLFHATR